MNGPAISAQQKRFLDEYADSLNIQDAALKAGYRKQTAAANGKNLLMSEKWQLELDKLTEKRAQYLDITKAYIVKKYLAILNWALFKNEDGKLTDPSLGLRALDGLIKQICPKTEGKNEDTIPILTQIKNLDTDKI